MLLLLAATACTSSSSGGGGNARVAATDGPLDRLDAVVRAVAADRKAVLGAVQAVQTGAMALDATDEVCLTGEGSAARTSHRKAVPLAKSAAARLKGLGANLAAYDGALTSLAAASVAVDGTARAALLRVVTNGKKEAAAVEVFRVRANGVWPQYAALDGFESLWITRAVTPWYRTAQEGSNAYQVMVEDQRPALNAARSKLGGVVDSVGPPISLQSSTLSAADKALEAVRARGTKPASP